MLRQFLIVTTTSILPLLIGVSDVRAEEQGKVELVTVRSDSLKENQLGDSFERNVSVYLPPGYEANTDKRYPVLYLLHGYTGTNALWAGGGYVEQLDLAKIFDALVADQRIKPMLIVAPDCHNKYRGCWYTNSSVTGNWEDFVVKDLVKYVDENYRTIKNRKSRGIAGHSMGGHGALKIAMRHSKMFTTVYAMSPAWVDFEGIFESPWIQRAKEAVRVETEEDFHDLHWRAQAFVAMGAAVTPSRDSKPFLAEFPINRNGKRNDKVWRKWLEHDLVSMVKRYAPELKSFEAIAFDCGTEEDLLPMNLAFSAALKKAGVAHTFQKFEGNHTNQVANQLRSRVLPLFSETLQHSAAKALVPATK